MEIYNYSMTVLLYKHKQCLKKEKEYYTIWNPIAIFPRISHKLASLSYLTLKGIRSPHIVYLYAQ